MPRSEISRLLTSKLVQLKNTDFPRHEFHVHQSLIDELCHPLCEDLRGYWKVFDGETVGRFAQYLYQSSCHFPAPLPVGTTTPIGSASGGYTPPEGSPRDVTANASDDISEFSGEILTPLRPLTPLECYEILELHTPPERSSPARPGTPAGHDYEAVFLAYAKLYILSYSQGIYALSDQCLSLLLKELTEVTSPRIDTRILGNVVRLLRYAYCSPRGVVPPNPLQPAWRELQNLASQFCALNIDVMGGNWEFQELLREGGALATDVMAKTVRRLGSAEAALAKAKEATAADKIALAKANKAAATAEAALAKATKSTSEATASLATWGRFGSASLGTFGGTPAANAPSSRGLFGTSPVRNAPSSGPGQTKVENASRGGFNFGRA